MAIENLKFYRERSLIIDSFVNNEGGRMSELVNKGSNALLRYHKMLI